jgi:hypothetical protein
MIDRSSSTQDVARATHLTLETLVYEVIQAAYRAPDVHPNPDADASASRIEALAVGALISRRVHVRGERVDCLVR